MEVLNRMSPYLQIAETGREVAAAFILCGQHPSCNWTVIMVMIFW